MGQTSIRKINVLLVENNPLQIEIIRNQLSDQFEIDSIDALSKIRLALSEKKTHIILLDLEWPKSQGLQTYLECRSQAPETPIVILVASSEDLVISEAIRKGAQDFLVKGQLDEEVILKVLRHSVERHEFQQDALDILFSDEMTKLNNRRAFQILAEGQIRLAIRNQNSCILMYLSIKDENNELLKEMSHILRNAFRGSDILARMGVNEFAVLALDANEEDKIIIPGRLEKRIKEYNQKQNGSPFLSISYGLAVFDYKSPTSVEMLIKEAEEDLHKNVRTM